MPEHKDITDPNIHEPKGIDTASSGQIFVADGVGSGSWQTATFPSQTGNNGRILGNDGTSPTFMNGKLAAKCKVSGLAALTAGNTTASDGTLTGALNIARVRKYFGTSGYYLVEFSPTLPTYDYMVMVTFEQADLTCYVSPNDQQYAYIFVTERSTGSLANPDVMYIAIVGGG